MIDLDLHFENELKPILDDFKNPKTQSRITNMILARVGRRYRAHIKSKYTSGQLIRGGRGPESLNGRLRVYKDKRRKNVYCIGEKTVTSPDGRRMRLANIFEHEGGYIVSPRKRKTAVVKTSGSVVMVKRAKARPFMTESFKTFGWSDIFKAEADSVYKKEMEKLNDSAGAV